MQNLSWRERAHFVGRALAGRVDTSPSSMSAQILSRIYPGASTDPPKRGTHEFLAAYSTSPWLRAVESRISAATASVAWQLFTVKREGKALQDRAIQRSTFANRKGLITDRERAGELVPILDHPFLTALDGGNSYMTGMNLRKLTQIYIDLVGESFWIKERNAVGAPIAFWPVPPDWIMSTPTPSQPFYRVSFGTWQEQIPQEEVLWMVDPDPVNPYGRGSGQSGAVADELDIDEFASKLVRSSFANRARPDLIISPKDGDAMLPAETQRLEQDWLNKHQGFWRVAKPYFATRQIDVHEISQDFQSLQMVPLRQHERDMILQVTGGIPPEMLGIVENSNRATIDAATLLMAEQVVIPRLEFQRSYFQEFLVRDYDERLIVDYVSPVREDIEAQAEALKATPWAATVNEHRQRAGLPPLEDEAEGKLHPIPMGVDFSETLVREVDEPLEDVIPEPDEDA